MEIVGEEKSVKALVRGLRVLAAINNFDVATVTRLEASLDIPKATIIRLIRTLIVEGYVVEAHEGEGYMVGPKAHDLSRGLTTESPTYALVHPLLVQLAKRIKWPSEFLSRDGDEMIIEASNRNLAPIKIGIFEGRRFPITASASGIAILASLSEADLEDFFAKQHAKGTEVDRSAVKARIADFRNKGYASWSEEDLEPGLTVIAIPVVAAGRPIGAISAVFFKEAMAEATLQDLVLPNLRATGAEIANLFRRADRAIA